MYQWLLKHMIDLVELKCTPLQVGESLREGREKLGFSLVAAGGKAGIDPAQLQKLEAGQWDRFLGGNGIGKRLSRHYAEQLGLNPIQIFFDSEKEFVTCLLKSNITAISIILLVFCLAFGVVATAPNYLQGKLLQPSLEANPIGSTPLPETTKPNQMQTSPKGPVTSTAVQKAILTVTPTVSANITPIFTPTNTPLPSLDIGERIITTKAKAYETLPPMGNVFYFNNTELPIIGGPKEFEGEHWWQTEWLGVKYWIECEGIADPRAC